MSVPPEGMDGGGAAPADGSAPAPAGAAAAPDAGAGQPASADPVDPSTAQDFIAQDEADQRPVGTVHDAILRDQQENPDSELVTADEQEQYDDFVSRCRLFICDPRKPSPNQPSPTQSVMTMLNDPRKSVPEAIGGTAAYVAFLIHNNAKRNNRTYTPDVMFHGADELVSDLYVLGNVARIFKGVPPLNLQGLQGGHYEFSEEEGKILDKSKIQAVLEFGKKMEQSGQITEAEREDARDFWKTQIEREINSGQVGDNILNRMDPNKLKQAMQDKLGHAHDPNNAAAPEPGFADAAEAQEPPAEEQAEPAGEEATEPGADAGAADREQAGGDQQQAFVQ